MSVCEAEIQSLAAIVNARQGNLMGSWLENCEAEVMVAQTIAAANVNLAKRGEAFSIRGPGVLGGRQRCGTNNGSAYRRLCDEGYFREEQRNIDGEPTIVIFPTQKLTQALHQHFAKPTGRLGPCI